MAIKRVWHGWTTLENADNYQHLLHDEIFPEIEAKKKYLATGALSCSEGIKEMKLSLSRL